MKPYYQDSAVTIYCGDCREIVPTLGRFDLLLTDPPYGVTQNKWDDSSVAFELFDKITIPIVCTGQNPFTAQMICRYMGRYKWCDIWMKTQAVGFLNAKVMPLRKHEDVMVFCHGKMQYTPQIKKKNPANIRPHGATSTSDNYGSYSIDRIRTIEIDETYPTSVICIPNDQSGQHPTQKPLRLFEYLVATYTLPLQTILDPFAGSGTTAVAAKSLNRKCVCIEREERYCEIAAKRCFQEYLQLTESTPRDRVSSIQPELEMPNDP